MISSFRFGRAPGRICNQGLRSKYILGPFLNPDSEICTKDAEKGRTREPSKWTLGPPVGVGATGYPSVIVNGSGLPAARIADGRSYVSWRRRSWVRECGMCLCQLVTVTGDRLRVRRSATFPRAILTEALLTTRSPPCSPAPQVHITRATLHPPCPTNWDGRGMTNRRSSAHVGGSLRLAWTARRAHVSCLRGR